LLVQFILRRLLVSVIVLWGVSVLIFSMIHLVPGDPVEVMLHETLASESAIADMRKSLELDRSLPEQYVVWLIGNQFSGDDDRTTRYGVIRGDFGRSIFKRVPVNDLIREKFPATLRLTLAAMAIALPMGLITGIISAIKRETLYDYGAMLAALVGVSLPSFWLGLLLMIVFGVELGWVRPFVGDRGTITLILPAITLSTPTVAIIARLTRSSLLDVLNEDYIRTAHAKGLRPRQVVASHALRNALIPVITILGLQFGHLLGGAVIVETVFAYPGLGREIVNAILTRDFPLVQGITLFSATCFILVNLCVDVTYLIIDPRLRRA